MIKEAGSGSRGIQGLSLTPMGRFLSPYSPALAIGLVRHVKSCRPYSSWGLLSHVTQNSHQGSSGIPHHGNKETKEIC